MESRGRSVRTHEPMFLAVKVDYLSPAKSEKGMSSHPFDGILALSTSTSCFK